MNIVNNKKAFFNYFIEEQYEAGIVLEGWEVKAIRAGKAQIKESYIIISNKELFLFGSHISALMNAYIHINLESTRTRKLLLNIKEINKLIGKVKRSGYTLIPLNLHYRKHRIKCEIGLAKGKKQYDKRAIEKTYDKKREIEIFFKKNNC